MLEAFTYMFNDNMLKKKALTYFVFVLLANLLTQISLIFAPPARDVAAPPQYYILSILSAIVMMIPTGYLISCIKAIMDQNENPVLPFLNVKNNFVLGFKFFINILLLSLSVGVMFVLMSVGVMFLLILIPAAILSVILPKIFLYIFLTILFIITFLAIIFYSPAFYCLLAKKEWYTAFFRFVRTTKVISLDIGNYLKRFGIIILLILAGGVVSSLVNLLCPPNYIGATIMAFLLSVISSYTVFVFAHLTAKSVKAECIE